MAFFELWRPDTSVQHISSFWNDYSPLWRKHEPVGEKIVGEIREHISRVLGRGKHEGNILDLCSGADYFSYFPSNIKRNAVYAFDISCEMLKLSPSERKTQGDARKALPYANNSFDVITMIFGWSHLKYKVYDFGYTRIHPEAQALYPSQLILQL